MTDAADVPRYSYRQLVAILQEITDQITYEAAKYKDPDEFDYASGIRSVRRIVQDRIGEEALGIPYPGGGEVLR